MASKQNRIIALNAEVTIKAAEGEGEAKGPPTFSVEAYTGGAMTLAGFDLPVVVDLASLKFGKSLVANLDHEGSKRVGHVTAHDKADGKLILSGVASAATPYRDEVVNSAASGFVWQASIEANSGELTEVAAGKSVKVNGQEFSGPLYVARKATLKGFAFVSHGADDNTSVKIAASAAGEKKMEKDFEAFVIEFGFNPEEFTELSAAAQASIRASFEGKKAKPGHGTSAPTGIEARKVNAARIKEIKALADAAAAEREDDDEAIEAIESLMNDAIEAKWSVEKFDLELLRAGRSQASTLQIRTRDRAAGRMNNRVIEAAICMAGRLQKHEEMFDDQTLQAAHDKFKGGIGLKQLFLLCAESNGYRSNYASDVTPEVHNYAFGMAGPQRSIKATEFSTLSISTILSNTANKYLMEAWNAVDMTPMSIASVRPVRDFKEITTVSLTGDLSYEKLGAAGEIKHGQLGNRSYTNKADTYAKMLAITRQDIINDDLGALTQVPRRLGRGAALKLNDIFWTEFLDNSTFFTSGNLNVSTDTGALGLTGLQQAETIFMNQTDPDGKPLGIMPSILLVPTALKATALSLMNSERIIDGTATAAQGDINPWRGRFTVHSSPYMSNSSYTGYSSSYWYLLASPQDLPVIEIVALNGRVEPVVETADADFNVLGVQMRGYSDIGVNLQEFRAGVKADGSAAG